MLGDFERPIWSIDDSPGMLAALSDLDLSIASASASLGSGDSRATLADLERSAVSGDSSGEVAILGDTDLSLTFLSAVSFKSTESAAMLGDLERSIGSVGALETLVALADLDLSIALTSSDSTAALGDFERSTATAAISLDSPGEPDILGDLDFESVVLESVPFKSGVSPTVLGDFEPST